MYGADCPQAPERKLSGSTFLKTFWIIILWKKKMIVPLLAGAAKTLVISMLSERVVLRVLVMLSEWAAAKSKDFE